MDLIIKGFIIGLGKIVPGVSGSILAIRLNVYEKMIYAINNLFHDFKNNFFFLLKLGVGILIAILLGSNIIIYLLANYYDITLIFFLILIATGLPTIIKKTHHYFVAFISLLIYFGLMFIPPLTIFNNYYFMGFLEAFTTIIPGISGTALFMSLGLYDELLILFSNIYTLPFSKIISFGLGALIGVIIIVRFISYCFDKNSSKTYGIVLGLLVGSMLMMLIKR